MQVPELCYARSGELRLAYQEFGSGPPLLLIPALLSNMEVSWEHEFIMRIFDLLSKHMNVVQVDKRGIGLSDRTDTAPTLEERIGDIVAVTDAVGWPRASVLGISEGGLMAQLFAATYPGELWASSTVRDLMIGGVATFEDRGEHALKGIDGEWRLFAVTSD